MRSVGATSGGKLRVNAATGGYQKWMRGLRLEMKTECFSRRYSCCGYSTSRRTLVDDAAHRMLAEEEEEEEDHLGAVHLLVSRNSQGSQGVGIHNFGRAPSLCN